MKNIILVVAVAFAFIAPSFAAEGAAVVEKANANCVCGHPVDASVEAVSIKVGEADKTIAVCSKECAEAVKKMDPKEAWKAAEAHNKSDAVVK